MPRDYKARENQLRSKARRDFALERRDLRHPSEPRQPPVGATSFPVKKINTETADAIAAFLANRGK